MTTAEFLIPLIALGIGAVALVATRWESRRIEGKRKGKGRDKDTHGHDGVPATH